MTATRPRPSFYALRPGGWRDYITLLHPPYTLWHLSYVAVGAALAPHMDWALLGWTTLPFLRLIRQRTLVLHGDEDELVPPFNARLLARLLPNAQLHLVPDGHLALVTSAQEIGPVIEAFRAAS